MLIDITMIWQYIIKQILRFGVGEYVVLCDSRKKDIQIQNKFEYVCLSQNITRCIELGKIMTVSYYKSACMLYINCLFGLRGVPLYIDI